MTVMRKSKGRVSIMLPASIKKRVSELARNDGVSDSAWIASAVSERIGALSAVDFSKERASGSGGANRALAILRRAGSQPPRPGDARI